MPASSKDVEAYLEEKNVRFLLKETLKAICVEQPEDVVGFIHGFLDENFSEGASAGASSPAQAAMADDDHAPELGETMDEKDMPKMRARGKRGGNVYMATPDDSYKPPKAVPKAPEVAKRLERVLRENVLFSHMDESQRRVLFDVLRDVKYGKGDVIIKQGDKNGQDFYIVDSGTCDVYVNDKKVGSIDQGGSFGELALMYNTPRAATIKASSDVMCFAIDRDTYRHFVIKGMKEKREKYSNFLKKVDILSTLTDYEVSTVTDALEPVSFKEGDTIVREGDPGDDFYIIEDGKVSVSKGKGNDKVGELSSGDYFGEIALLTEKPRAATVKATSAVKCLKLERKAFNRVLGPVQDLLKRNMDKYKQILSK